MGLIRASGYDKTLTNTEEFDTIVDGGRVLLGPYGRNGTNGLRLNGQGGLSSPMALVNLAGQYGTIIRCFAFQPTAIGTGKAVVGFDDNGTTQAQITIDSDGTCHATGTATTFTLPDFAYRHWQVKCTIGNSTGAWQVKIDNVTVLDETGLDTQQTANAYCTQARFGGGANVGGTYDYDDDILMDTSGSTMNDFIGDKRVLEQMPTGDSATMQFTPSTGTDGYAMVDETDPDDDTTYIEDATVGHVARFTFPALPVSTAEVLTADVLWFGKKTDAGTRTLKGSAKSVASVASGADVAMSTVYGYSRGHFETDPATSSAWTPAGVNAAEHGVEVVA